METQLLRRSTRRRLLIKKSNLLVITGWTFFICLDSLNLIVQFFQGDYRVDVTGNMRSSTVVALHQKRYDHT